MDGSIRDDSSLYGGPAQNVDGELHGGLHGELGLMIQTWSVPP